MKYMLYRLPDLASKFQYYLPVLTLFVSVFAVIIGFNPLDSDGGTGR